MCKEGEDKKDNVVHFGGVTKLDIPVEGVIKGLEEVDFKDIVIIGLTKDNETYYAANLASVGRVLLRVEAFKKVLLSIWEDGDDD